jgi:hypothetical protein
MLFLINHGQKFLFCLLNFVKPLISGKQIKLMNLLVFERNFDLVDNIAEFIHAQKRIVYFAFVEIDFNQVMNVLDFIFSTSVILHLKDWNYAFDQVRCETLLHWVKGGK